MMKRTKSIALLLIFAIVLAFTITDTNVVRANAAPKLSASEATIYIGCKKTLKLKNAKADEVKWSSSNSNVASVNKSGVVVGKKKGTATINAKYDKKTYKCKVTVKVSKLTVKSTTISVGHSKEVRIVNNQSKIIWSSSDSTIASVNKNGVVVGKKPGTVTISAKVYEQIYKCKIRVVKALGEFDFNLVEPDEMGHENIIDCLCNFHYSWFYHNKYNGKKSYRSTDIGSTDADIIQAYGETEKIALNSRDRYLRAHKLSAKYYMEYSYYSAKYNKNFYLRIYFNDKDTAILFIQH